MISARNCDDVFLQRNRLVFILYLFLQIPYKIMKTNIQNIKRYEIHNFEFSVLNINLNR